MGCRKLDISPLEKAPLQLVYSAGSWPEKTGVSYSYFGARYYDPNISIWLSVDPLSDKYPSLSPYTYTANNPIRLIDPNGMEITEYENAQTKEVINIDDGIDERVQVSDADWGSIQQLSKDWDAGYKDADAGVAEIMGDRSLVAGEWQISETNTALPIELPLLIGIGQALESVALRALGVASVFLTLSGDTRMDKATDHSPNERHGDAKAAEKAAKQLAELAAKLEAAKTGAERQAIKQKIKNVRQNAEKNRKGTEHSRGNKR